MKIYEFEFNCDKETAIEEVIHDVKKPSIMFEDKVIYGRKMSNFVNLYHGITYRNSFRPILTLHFKEIEPGKTIVKGFFRWHLFVFIFSIVWLLLVIKMASSIDVVNSGVLWMPIFFIVFFFGIVTYGTYCERKNKERLINHIKMHQNIINNK